MDPKFIPSVSHVGISNYSLVEIDNCNAILGTICDYIVAVLKMNPLMFNGACAITIKHDHLEYLFDVINEGRDQDSILRYDIYTGTRETNVSIEFVSFDKLVLSFEFEQKNYFFMFDDRFESIAEFSKECRLLNALVPPGTKNVYNIFPFVIGLLIKE